MGLYCCGISEESSLSVLPQIDVKYGVQALKHRQSSGTHYSLPGGHRDIQSKIVSVTEAKKEKPVGQFFIVGSLL